jgi:hypothetical protein
VLTSADLKSHYTNVIRKLKEKPFGPFDALVILLGDEQAMTVARAQCISVRRMGGHKRVAEEELPEDSERPRIIRRA